MLSINNWAVGTIFNKYKLIIRCFSPEEFDLIQYRKYAYRKEEIKTIKYSPYLHMLFSMHEIKKLKGVTYFWPGSICFNCESHYIFQNDSSEIVLDSCWKCDL